LPLSRSFKENGHCCGYGIRSHFCARDVLEFLTIITFILVIATFVQFVELFLRKNSPGLYEALGIYLPLITTNCIILGVAILNAQQSYSLLESVFHALGAGLPFEGVPIALILASIMSMAFMGFQGLIRL